jgi:hypothetical protein
MLSLLRDFLWWCGVHGWRALRVMSGDDAFERHMACHTTPPGASPTQCSTMCRQARRAVYDRELDRKWSRYTACGRCFER